MKEYVLKFATLYHFYLDKDGKPEKYTHLTDRSFFKEENIRVLSEIYDENEEFLVKVDGTFALKKIEDEISPYEFKANISESTASKNSRALNFVIHDLKNENSFLYQDFFTTTTHYTPLFDNEEVKKQKWIDFAIELFDLMFDIDAETGFIADETGKRIHTLSGPERDRIVAKGLKNYFKFDLTWEQSNVIDTRRFDVIENEIETEYPIHLELQYMDKDYAMKYVLPPFYYSLTYLKEPYDERIRNPFLYVWDLD